MNLVLFGPPGVGKGTQGMRLAEEFSLAHLATGDILRAAVRDGTEYGKQAKAFMDGGKLVPDDIVVGMIEERIVDAGQGFLLDGFPRNIEQAQALATLLGRDDFKVNLIPDNPTGGSFEGASRERIAAFKAALDRAHVPATVRLTRGRDIEAACGQLAAAPKARRRSESAAVTR